MLRRPLALAVILTLLLTLVLAHRHFFRVGPPSLFPGAERGVRRVLVLDLDETLVHAYQVHPDGEMMLLLRPHLPEFLRRADAMFDELVVFTAATQDYADQALARVEAVSGVRLLRRYYRESCSTNDAGHVAKDLRVLREPHGTVALLVDNTPSAYSMQPEAGIPIQSYVRDDPADVALLDTLDVLQARLLQVGSGHGSGGFVFK